MKPLSRKTKTRLMIIAFALLLFSVSLTPLAPEAEIMTRLMADAIGIDVTDEGVVVTAKTINSGTAEVVSGKGEILREALQNIDERYGRKLELGHCGLVVLGSDLDRDDMVSIFMSILSDASVNAGCSVVAAKEKAQKIIEDTQNLPESTNDGLTGYVTFSDERLAVTVPSVLEFAQALRSKSATGILPIIDLQKKESESGGKGGNQGGGESQSGSSGQTQSDEQSNGDEATEIVPPKTHRVIGETVYDISEADSYGLMWLQERTKEGLVATELEIKGEKFTVRAIIEKKKSSIDAAFDHGPSITLSVEARLRLVDRYAVLYVVEQGMSLDDVMSEIEGSYKKTVSDEIKVTAEMSRTDDFLGYKTYLYRADAKMYNAWSGDLNEVSIKYDTVISVV